MNITKTQIKSLGVALCLAVAAAGAGVAITGCTTGDKYNRSTGEYIDDKTVSSRVSSALSANPEYKFDDVIVTTFRGTVQLSGFVNTADQKSKAADIAKKVDGVKGVENNITVKDKM